MRYGLGASVTDDTRLEGGPLQDEIARLLESAGLPVQCCPTCEKSEWLFEADTRYGVAWARCNWCSRYYTGMTAKMEYAHWAEVARDAARINDVRRVRMAHTRMRVIWESSPELARESRILVCTQPGRCDCDGDEIPF